MSIVVSKFGGSSLADASSFRRVLEIVRHRAVSHYTVLSAPGRRFSEDDKITDLLHLASSLAESGEDPGAPLGKVRSRLNGIIRDIALGIDPDALTETLESDVHYSRDLAITRGETLCARIFAEFSGIPFVDADELIHFDSKGCIRHDETFDSIRKMAGQFPRAVIPGFYGSMPNGEIKSFSRGGSDITGALIAAALNADLYENWTDVDGLMSIDPAICAESVHHKAVSYRQMQALSQAGAYVLHPSCLQPVREAGVPTLLKNTFFPGGPGTYISDHIQADVPCICVRENVGAMDEIAAGPNPGFPHGNCAAMISIFGADEDFPEKAVGIIRPEACFYRDHCLRMFTTAVPEPAALQRLHALLFENLSPS